MGTWGTGIKANDTFEDVYDEFMDLYNDGYSVKQITQYLIENNEDEFSNDFWFAIANCQWECKELDKEIYNKVEKIISSGEDILLWKQQDASLKDIKKREVVLNNFLEKLKTEKEKPKRRIKKKFYNSVFNEGDCLIYKMENGNYGGAFVLTDEQDEELPKNFIAITNINKSEKPTINDFLESFVLFEKREQTYYDYVDGNRVPKQVIEEIPLVGFFMQWDFKNTDFQIEILGNLTTNKTFKEGNPIRGFGWNRLKQGFNTALPNWTILDNKKIKIKKWI